MATRPGRDVPPLITLTTDFGQQDGYVGAMQGVIFNICPRATLTSLSHDIPPQDVQTAGFVLYQAFSYYPPDTIHCVVVDPGVGSKRRAIAIRTSHGIFVGPDNGVFSLVLTAEAVSVLEAVTLTNPDYQLASVSATFHGRDIFAPAAAHIANGIPISRFGPSAINLVRLNYGSQQAPGGQTLKSRVMHIDRFGNLILDMTSHDIENVEAVTFTIGDKVIKSLSYTFADVRENELLAYAGSTRDHIEIAVRNGNAAQTLGVQLGDVVKVTGHS
jgi:S-adenosylmethionine hydrolase